MGKEPCSSPAGAIHLDILPRAIWQLVQPDEPVHLRPRQQPDPPEVIAQIKATITQQAFGGAATYITYLTAGVICLILVFNMAFGGIDLVLDRQLGYLNTLLTSPIPRAAIYFSGVLQNLVKVMALALLTFLIALVIPDGLVLQSGFGLLNFIGIFGVFALLGFGLSCVFTALALSVRCIDSLVAIVNFLTLPLIFMSNALFPSGSVPRLAQSDSPGQPDLNDERGGEAPDR